MDHSTLNWALGWVVQPEFSLNRYNVFQTCPTNVIDFFFFLVKTNVIDWHVFKRASFMVIKFENCGRSHSNAFYCNPTMLVSLAGK